MGYQVVMIHLVVPKRHERYAGMIDTKNRKRT
ncbi:hypothetical protein GGI64_004685 [Rhizobium leguminosarum]|uniref:Uncharacterized protein n=1 Tax=Rhizobium leguminosarum TaxID=384 RepID=A0A7Z0E1Z3_RHILE|nr:hypothetical protein [Rhizobium leguminosarum]